MPSRLTLALAATALAVTATACGNGQEQQDAALEDALTKSLTAADSVGSPESLNRWASAFEQIKTEQKKTYGTNPPQVSVKGEYTRTACNLLRTNLPVSGGPTGTTPVDPRATLAKAGILSTFADEQKNEPDAKTLKVVVDSAIIDWRRFTEQNVALTNDPFGPISDVCQGKPVPLRSAAPTTTPAAPTPSATPSAP